MIKPILEENRATDKKDKKIYSMSWDALPKSKFVFSLIGASIAAILEIINISRNLRQNNLLFMEASWFTVRFVSLIFVVPVLAVKGGFDAIRVPSQKARFLKSAFWVITVSGVFFVCMAQRT